MIPQHHDTTGLNYLNNRDHDPQFGIFTSVDPLVSATWEPYVYASANPITYSHPTGLRRSSIGPSGIAWVVTVTAPPVPSATQITVVDAYGQTVESRCGGDAGSHISHRYDAAGRRIASTVDGVAASYRFDAAGRMVREDDPNRGITRFTYDAAGNVTARVDAAHNRVETESTRAAQHHPNDTTTLYLGATDVTINSDGDVDTATRTYTHASNDKPDHLHELTDPSAPPRAACGLGARDAEPAVDTDIARRSVDQAVSHVGLVRWSCRVGRSTGSVGSCHCAAVRFVSSSDGRAR